MTEKMINRLKDLRARQATGEHMFCPRCGQDTMKADLHTNALSRHVDRVYVCDSCGTAEALLDFMKQELPITMWAMFRPVRQPSGFGSMPAADVLAKVMHEQIDTLTHIFKLCAADPDHQDEYRAEAYESCQGLTELWTEPFTARYDSKDSPVVLRFRMTDDGEIEVAGNILNTK